MSVCQIVLNFMEHERRHKDTLRGWVEALNMYAGSVGFQSVPHPPPAANVIVEFVRHCNVSSQLRQNSMGGRVAAVKDLC